MLHDVISASHIDGYRINLTFDDGKSGIVDFSEYPAKGGVFRQFEDIDFFKDFSVSNDLGTLVWKNEIDVAPETLYIKAIS